MTITCCPLHVFRLRLQEQLVLGPMSLSPSRWKRYAESRYPYEREALRICGIMARNRPIPLQRGYCRVCGARDDDDMDPGASEDGPNSRRSSAPYAPFIT